MPARRRLDRDVDALVGELEQRDGRVLERQATASSRGAPQARDDTPGEGFCLAVAYRPHTCPGRPRPDQR